MTAKLAKDAHASLDEFPGGAAASFRTKEDERMLEGMIDEIVKATAQASAAIDDALAYIEAPNKRIAALEAMKGEK